MRELVLPWKALADRGASANPNTSSSSQNLAKTRETDWGAIK